MPHYLGQYMGKGTLADPFRPVGSDQPDWRAIDLRPDSSRLDGGGLNACLVHLPVADSDPRLQLLGHAPKDTLGPGLKAMVRTRLGHMPTMPTLDRMVGELLMSPPANGWKPLQPHSIRKRYEVWLGGLLFSVPVLSGGSLPATDDFNRANEVPMAGNWSAVPGAANRFNLLLNVAAPVASAESATLWNADSFSGDHYSQCIVTSGSTGGLLVRCRTATQFDAYLLFTNGTGNVEIYKIVNDGYTLLTSPNFAFSSSDVLKVDAVGSTITAYKNGVAQASPATDSAVTGGAAGLYGQSINVFLDDWGGGNVGAAQSVVPVLMRQYRERRD